LLSKVYAFALRRTFPFFFSAFQRGLIVFPRS